MSDEPQDPAAGQVVAELQIVLDALKDAHRQELQRQALQWAERLRHSDNERLKLREAQEEQQDAWADESDSLRRQLEQARSAAAATQTELARAEERLLAALRDAERGQQERQQVDARLASLVDQVEALKTREREQAERAHSAAAEAKAQLARTEEQLLAAQRDAERGQQERQQVDAQLASLVDQVEALNTREREQAERAHSAAALAKAQLARAEERLLAAQHEVESEGRERRHLAAQLQPLRNQIDALRAREGELSLARDRLVAELTAARKAGQSNDARNRAALEAFERKLAQSRSEAERLHSGNLAAHRRLERLRQSGTFRLGEALVGAGRSWRGLINLPRTFLQLAGAQRVARGPDTRGTELAARAVDPAELDVLFDRDGLAAAEAFVHERSRGRPDAEQATLLTQLARRALAGAPDEALRIARRAFALDPRPYRRKWLGFMLHDAGSIVEAHELLRALPAGKELKPPERHKLERIAGRYRLKSLGVTVPPRASVAYATTHGPIAYIAASSLPFHVTGYTLRTQAILHSWQRLGRNAICLTRPGYPDDRTEPRQPRGGEEHVVDGVHYRSINGPHRRKTAPDRYIEEAARCIEAALRDCGASVVHAASNHENALPALIAARRLGLPFVYEVRGLWEYTAASSRPGWEGSDAFALEGQLEALVASHADRVFTLTQALADELVSRGVERTRIALAPNAVDAQAFLPMPPDAELALRLAIPPKAFVVGYAGSVVAYEGLDDLIVAMGYLRRTVPDALALIVGDGNNLPGLRAQAASLGLSDQVRFTGHVAPAEVARHLSLVQAVVLPRKPFTVCRLVSPLKPLEAMAMGIPVVVSDVAALAEMVQDGVTGFVFPSGRPEALAELLARLAADPAGCRSVGDAGRDHVVRHRQWDLVCSAMLQDYPSQGHAGGDDGKEDEGVQLAPQAVDSAPTTPALPLGAGVNAFTDAERSAFEALLQQTLARAGAPALTELLAQQTAGRSDRFAAFCELKAAAACMQQGDLAASQIWAERALARDQSASTLRSAARLFSHAADLGRAAALAQQLRAVLGSPGNADERFIGEIHGRHQLEEAAKAVAAARRTVAQPRRVLNLLAFSLPYTSVGYATRSHGLALGIRHAGWEILPFTRPGFPQDFKPELQGLTLPESDLVEGITYGRLFDVQRTAMNEVEYLQSCVERYTSLIERTSPAIVHAASNYVTALPALIAARRLGVPFVYEVRGFWEVTRSSREEAFEHTPKYRLMQLFEGLVARQADRVLTITTAMKEELIERGVAPERIDIAYNSVDVARFTPRVRDAALATELGIPDGLPVIGYIGSFVDYEGLDDLLRAAAALKAAGSAFHLLLVGDGAMFESLRLQVEELGLGDRLTMTGRVPHDRVEDYYSLIDIAPFPRKPWQVSELVSPLKPFEAMALCKAVVVPGTRALVEIVSDGETGLVFRKGDVQSLQLALASLLEDPQRRAQLGARAREWVKRERSWDVAGQTVSKCYEAALASPSPSPATASA
jgi:glycosyltransferase involved in cell wall biosynthesis